MRTFLLPLALVAAAAFIQACGSSEQPKTSNGGSADARPMSKTTSPHAAGGPQTAGAPDTSALDKKIEEAEAKAKAAGATPSDKMAAASAYLERANVFYAAGNPSLYKFALRDFRIALRYDPSNAEARDKRDQIVGIYQQMGRPVPDLGNEP
ncbi:MAG TPA: tetratricopeptide repeat protein [Pyrinomonadaceae bacterium]